jgi:hypothetical protein
MVMIAAPASLAIRTAAGSLVEEPSNTWTTNDGTIASPNPVIPSNIAVVASKVLISLNVDISSHSPPIYGGTTVNPSPISP